MFRVPVIEFLILVLLTSLYSSIIFDCLFGLVEARLADHLEDLPAWHSSRRQCPPGMETNGSSNKAPSFLCFILWLLSSFSFVTSCQSLNVHDGNYWIVLVEFPAIVHCQVSRGLDLSSNTKAWRIGETDSD